MPGERQPTDAEWDVVLAEFLGETCLSGTNYGKVCTPSTAVGVSKAYGSIFLRNWSSRTLWIKAIWCWTAHAVYWQPQWYLLCEGIAGVLQSANLQGKHVVADKDYDSDHFVWWLDKQGAIDVIPSHRVAKHPRKIDRYIYMEWHLVENLFLKLKAHYRNVPLCFSPLRYLLLSWSRIVWVWRHHLVFNEQIYLQFISYRGFTPETSITSYQNVSIRVVRQIPVVQITRQTKWRKIITKFMCFWLEYWPKQSRMNQHPIGEMYNFSVSTQKKIFKMVNDATDEIFTQKLDEW